MKLKIKSSKKTLFIGWVMFLSVSLSIILPLPLFANSTLIAEKKQLDQEYQNLLRTFWKLKEDQIKKRQSIKDELDHFDSKLNFLYQNRNSLIEEEFMIRDNLNQSQEKLNTYLELQNNFNQLIEKTVEEERSKLQTGLPIMLEDHLKKINAIGSLKSSKSKIQKTSSPLIPTELSVVSPSLSDLLDYKLSLISSGEKVTIYPTKIYQAKGANGSQSAFILRYGFIQAYYQLTKSKQLGLLIKSSGHSGVKYFWEENLPLDLSPKIENTFNEVINLIPQNNSQKYSENKNKIINLSSINIPIDPIQAGLKIVSFQTVQLGFIDKGINFFKSGGFIMYPLLFLFLWAWFLIFEKTIQFYRFNKKIKHLSDWNMDKLNSFNENQPTHNQLVQFGNNLEKLLKGFIQAKPESREVAEKYFQEHLPPIVFNLEKKLTTLTIIISAAPLLGLLGTVTGMIQLFEVITLYGTSNAKVLAGGISVALITTQTGLAIAIPVLIIHHFLVRKKKHLLNQLEIQLYRVINNYHL